MVGPDKQRLHVKQTKLVRSKVLVDGIVPLWRKARHQSSQGTKMQDVVLAGRPLLVQQRSKLRIRLCSLEEMIADKTCAPIGQHLMMNAFHYR